MPVDGGRGENRSCTCDGLGGVTLCEDCASPSAAPDVTALALAKLRARWLGDPVVLSAVEADALLAEVERLREEIRVREQSQIPVIPRGAQAKIERLKAEVERLRQERNEAHDA